jgi:Domain of unknown function (DUF1824)
MLLLWAFVLLAMCRVSAFVTTQVSPCAHTILLCRKLSVAADDEISNASSLLSAYDKAFLQRVKAGRAEGRTAAVTEFQRALSLGSQALLEERKELAQACRQLAAQADIVTLGIMAESGQRGLQVLKQWVPALALQKGVLRALDDTDREIPIDTLDGSPVYIKYNSREGGDAYMKPYAGHNRKYCSVTDLTQTMISMVVCNMCMRHLQLAAALLGSNQLLQ